MGCSQSLERRIPSVYIAATDLSLKQKRGYLWYRNKHFSGRVYELHPDGDTALLASYVDGKEEGWSQKWYANGKKMEERFYVHGKKQGRHTAWWEDGKKRFEYYFLNDEHEGQAKEWYNNGQPYRFFHYTNGQEDGLQQMWWEDGKTRANYVVKDGQQYGLIGRKLCSNEKS